MKRHLKEFIDTAAGDRVIITEDVNGRHDAWVYHNFARGCTGPGWLIEAKTGFTTYPEAHKWCWDRVQPRNAEDLIHA